MNHVSLWSHHLLALHNSPFLLSIHPTLPSNVFEKPFKLSLTIMWRQYITQQIVSTLHLFIHWHECYMKHTLERHEVLPTDSQEWVFFPSPLLPTLIEETQKSWEEWRAVFSSEVVHDEEETVKNSTLAFFMTLSNSPGVSSLSSEDVPVVECQAASCERRTPYP